MKQRTDTPYWDNYYGNDLAPKPPSDFAKFCFNYTKPEKMLIDLGCGNGRDSMFFCRSGLKVTAVDLSKSAIASFSQAMPIFALCDDFVKTKLLKCVDYDYAYARWTIHAISKAQQDELLPNVYHALKPGGLFFSETRTINDEKYGQGEALSEHEFIFDEHYRRFLDPEEFLAQLKNIGFVIEHYEESDRFSVMNGDAPTLIRVVARKVMHGIL